MLWNWKHENWPKFTYSAEKLVGFENTFLHKSGVLLGSLKHVSNEDKDNLKVDLMSDEAFKSSEIEGEILNRESLHSSIRKHFGLKSDNRKVSPAEYGISEMMVELYKSFDSPLSHNQLFAWHQMLMNGRRDLDNIGKYRSHEDPMQIVSGRIDQPNVHFEAPPSREIPEEMGAFISWFNNSTKLEPLTRAGIAHLYFESIHPFEDGNGRIGRAISEKSLSQSLNRPTLIALSHVIAINKKKYYSALQSNSVGLEITDWLIYFCEMVLEAQDYTQSLIEFLIEKGKFFLRFRNLLNERQQKVVDRIFKEGINGFIGGLSADNYIKISGTTASTATRDLQKMVDLGAMIKTGQRKGTRYYLNIEHPSAKPIK